uniref:Uncharacterized protein n=1 Tax=Meloidogyne incognita TaxID=6306 RepID=A0A914M9B7_MELIC
MCCKVVYIYAIYLQTFSTGARFDKWNQESFRPITRFYHQGAAGVSLVYDITR